MTTDIERTSNIPALAAPVPRQLAVSNDFNRSAQQKSTKIVTTNWATSPVSLRIGALLVTVWLLVALLAPLLAPYSPDQVAAGPRLSAPSAAHPFGTDALGRDMWSRVLFGSRIAVEVALLGVGISALLGVTLGLLAGYYGGWLDQALSRVMDVWMAFPGLLLAVVIVARLGPSLRNSVIALGIVGAPSFYRLVRGGSFSASRSSYVESALAVGCSGRRIILRHILPNLFSPLVVLLTMRLGVMILAAGSLSFIGLGAQPPTPEWGALLASGQDYVDSAPWLAVLPGLCITLTVVGLNLLGDGLRDVLDPQHGRRF
jgi:ABC-type dipeptide/oligopeptide/nickel transport system permease subunit